MSDPYSADTSVQLDTVRKSLRSEIALVQRQVNDRQDALGVESRALGAALRGLSARLDSLDALAGLDAVSRWIAQAELRTAPLISVVTPTRNRPERLLHAVRSVCAQTYTNWEMLVVEDGGAGDAAAVVSEVRDPRVRWTRIERGGSSAARNHALDVAHGSLVAYLDDDNTLDPGWLKAVAWAFETRPDCAVLYGSVLIDDVSRINGGEPGSLPRLFFRPYDRAALLEENLADVSAIAHRAGLPEARFDERLSAYSDWDLLIRLTEDAAPLALPVIACYYTTDAPDRLSAGDLSKDAEILAAAHGRRHHTERRGVT
jgi:glycosyltransferase involved in cell wall biosynthesis